MKMEGGLSSVEEEMDLRISTEDGLTMSVDMGASRENSGLDWTIYTACPQQHREQN